MYYLKNMTEYSLTTRAITSIRVKTLFSHTDKHKQQF